MMNTSYNEHAIEAFAKKEFNDFLLKEYDNIAQAHFNTKQTLTAFFRYYLLIIALPAPFSAFLFTKLSELNTLGLIVNVVSIVSLLLFFVGLVVMLYITGLQIDALLYARQVNGIRWYFYKYLKNNQIDRSKIKVLPTDNKKPKFNGFHGFLFIVLTFSIIDGFYLWLYITLSFCNQFPKTSYFIAIPIISLFIHWISYFLVTSYYEKKWDNKPRQTSPKV